MFHCKWFLKSFLSVAIATIFSVSAAADLVENGGFETGDTSGWESLPTANSTFEITNVANSGNFAAIIFNIDETSSAVVKQANLGEGMIQIGDIIDISFAAQGEGAIGGVAFAEVFAEIAGGGVSDSVILGGGPLALNSNDYMTFNFQYEVISDVSGGVTLQFAVVTGADVGSTSTLFIDDVSVTNLSSSVPEPASGLVVGLGVVGLSLRRKRS